MSSGHKQGGLRIHTYAASKNSGCWELHWCLCSHAKRCMPVSFRTVKFWQESTCCMS